MFFLPPILNMVQNASSFTHSGCPWCRRKFKVPEHYVDSVPADLTISIGTHALSNK